MPFSPPEPTPAMNCNAEYATSPCVASVPRFAPAASVTAPASTHRTGWRPSTNATSSVPVDSPSTSMKLDSPSAASPKPQ